MIHTVFRLIIILVALIFTYIFCFVVLPTFIEKPDFIGAVLSGFVNPYATGYSADAISCWVILMIWIIYEAKTTSIKYGWICLLIGIVPGVAVGFATYLLLRTFVLKMEI